MIESFVYGLLATSVMLAINKFVTTIFIKVKNTGLALVYGSLAAKLLFLSVFTLVIKNDLQNSIIYCSVILIGIIYSNLNTIVKLK
tara:strand:- start:242 stop:499 length:258 start_codon:yes stop_codon:yes gene_type:complete